MGWRVFAQGQMRSERVVIARVGRRDPAQVGFAEDDRVSRHSLRIEPISLSACPFRQVTSGPSGDHEYLQDAQSP